MIQLHVVETDDDKKNLGFAVDCKNDNSYMKIVSMMAKTFFVLQICHCFTKSHVDFHLCISLIHNSITKTQKLERYLKSFLSYRDISSICRFIFHFTKWSLIHFVVISLYLLYSKQRLIWSNKVSTLRPLHGVVVGEL